MTNEQPQPWDQQPGESEAAYGRFLFYRAFGPGRSLLRAYRASLRSVGGAPDGTTRHHVPGQWKHDSAAYHWPARARAWDGYCLQQHGQKVVLLYADMLENLARKAHRSLRRLKGPETWKELLDAVALLGSLIAPETVEAVAQQAPQIPIPVSPAVCLEDDTGAGI